MLSHLLWQLCRMSVLIPTLLIVSNTYTVFIMCLALWFYIHLLFTATPMRVCTIIPNLEMRNRLICPWSRGHEWQSRDRNPDFAMLARALYRWERLRFMWNSRGDVEEPEWNPSPREQRTWCVVPRSPALGLPLQRCTKESPPRGQGKEAGLWAAKRAGPRGVWPRARSYFLCCLIPVSRQQLVFGDTSKEPQGGAFCLGLGRDPTELEMLGAQRPTRLREECRRPGREQVGPALRVRSRPFPLGPEPRSSHRTRPGWLRAPFMETPRTRQGGAQPSALARSLHVHAAGWNSKSECSCEAGWGGERSQILARRGRLPASLRSGLRLFSGTPPSLQGVISSDLQICTREARNRSSVYWLNQRASSVWRLLMEMGGGGDFVFSSRQRIILRQKLPSNLERHSVHSA